MTNTPAWVELEGGFLVGTPNNEVVGGAAFKEGQGVSAKYAIAKEANYTITFASEDGKAAVTVPVMYNGMTTNTMDVTYPTVSPWAVWNVSMDGKVFSQNSTSLTGEATNDFTYHNFVPFQLNTFNDDYQLVVFESKENGLFEDSSGAVKLQGEKGDVKLTVAPLTSGSREFLVYALPKAVYESLENGFDDMLENEFTTVKSDYDRYFLMNLVQKENKVETKAPTVLLNNWENLECKKDQNGMYTEVVNSYLNYYGDEVYVVNATVGKAVTVYPNITDWAPNEEDFSNVYCFDSSGEPVSQEPGMDEKDNWIFTLQVTENAPIFMAFKDASGNVLRVLVIERDDY